MLTPLIIDWPKLHQWTLIDVYKFDDFYHHAEPKYYWTTEYLNTFLSAGGGGRVDFLQAQHGNGFYKKGVEQNTQLQRTILQGKVGESWKDEGLLVYWPILHLLVWWLQLGLVSAAHLSPLSAGQAPGDHGQGPPSVPHRRLVRKNAQILDFYYCHLLSVASTTRNLTVIPMLVLTKSNLSSSQPKNICFLRGKIKSHFGMYRYIILFLRSLQFTIVGLRKKIKEKKPNGGWGDHRDHQLCMNFTMSGNTLRWSYLHFYWKEETP